jgi:hypothetical protein
MYVPSRRLVSNNLKNFRKKKNVCFYNILKLLLIGRFLIRHGKEERKKEKGQQGTQNERGVESRGRKIQKQWIVVEEEEYEERDGACIVRRRSPTITNYL